MKVALAVLGAVAIGLQTAYPHAAWVIPITTAVTAALGALHLVPSGGQTSSTPSAGSSP